jgi:cyclophilin family peptidyl-prolyl cis-trans isomerase
MSSGNGTGGTGYAKSRPRVTVSTTTVECFQSHAGKDPGVSQFFFLSQPNQHSPSGRRHTCSGKGFDVLEVIDATRPCETDCANQYHGSIILPIKPEWLSHVRRVSE